MYIVDLGCGSDPERWKPNSIKLDLNVCDTDRLNIDTIEDLNEDDKYQKVIGYDATEETMPFQDNTVSTIYATASIRHMFNNVVELSNLLNKLLRVTADKGMLVVNDYCELFDPESGDYHEVEYQRIGEILERAIEIPCLEGEWEVEFEGTSNDGTQYCWVLRAHKY